jgi:DNA-binding transcriptional LysR family regulator
MDIELRLLRHARRLAEHRSFSRAARSLGISQPALTRSIQVLERSVDARLFVRSPHGVEPTEVGQMFLDRAAEVLSRSDELRREMSLLRGLDEGDLRIGAGVYPAAMYVGEATTRLIHAHPETRLRVVSGTGADLIPLLARREVDLVVANAHPVSTVADLHITRLRRRQGYFVVRADHPLTRTREVALDDIAAFPVCGTSGLNPATLEPLMRASPRGRALPSVVCESLPMIVHIVAGSDAVGLMPLGIVSAEVMAGRLALLPLVEPWLAGDFAVMRSERRNPSPSWDLFVRLVLEVDAEDFALEQRLAKRLLGRRNLR